MSHRKSKADRDTRKALGCVVYDMHLLATALLLRQYARASGQKDLRELASDMLLLKGRSLFEFLTSKHRLKKRITVHDFALDPRQIPQELRDFFGFASQRSAHLSWDRAQDPLPRHPNIDSDGPVVLNLANEVCSQILAKGITLSLPRHRAYYQALLSQIAQLHSR
jgi:hypothetical protein